MIWSLTNPWWLNSGANEWQWATSLIACAGWGVAAWLYYQHRCAHCWRKGQVPIHGSIHSVCKKHALEHGHVHGGKPIEPQPKKGAAQ